MKKGTLIPLVMGVVVGGLAIKLGLDTVQRAKAGARVEMVSAVVAVEDIPATSEITDTMVKVIETPVTPLLGRDSFKDLSGVVGRVAEGDIPRGSALREDLLAPEGTPPGLTVRIPKGFRAVSLKINEVSAVGYQLRPGVFVDVIAVMRSGRTREMVSRIVLQGVQVVAVGRTLSSPSDPNGKSKAAKSVTLLVKNSDVPRLHLAETQGKITLAMRSPEDDQKADAGTASEGELWGEKPEKPESDENGTKVVQSQPLQAQANYTLTMVNGTGQASTVTFASENSTRRVGGWDNSSRGSAPRRIAGFRMAGPDQKSADRQDQASSDHEEDQGGDEGEADEGNDSPPEEIPG